MMDDDFHDESRFESDFEIDIGGFSQKSLICGLYHKLNQFERHFDTITTKYKRIALTWILATYAAIGFLLSSETTYLPFNHLIAVSIVCFLGLVAISIIWHLDMNIYQKFWAAIYIEEMTMEDKFDFLLPSRNTAILIDENRERLFSQSFLYIIGNMLFIVTMGGSIVYLLKEEKSYIPVLVSFVFLIIAVLISYYMFKFARNVRAIFNQLVEKKGNGKHLLNK